MLVKAEDSEPCGFCIAEVFRKNGLDLGTLCNFLMFCEVKIISIVLYENLYLNIYQATLR